MGWCEVKNFRFVKAIRKTTCIWVFQSNSINRYVFKKFQWEQSWEQESLKAKYENAQRDANKARGTMDYKSSLVTETGACRCFRKNIFWKLRESFLESIWHRDKVLGFTKENFKIVAEHCVWLKNFFPSFSLIHNPRLGVPYLQIKGLH